MLDSDIDPISGFVFCTDQDVIARQNSSGMVDRDPGCERMDGPGGFEWLMSVAHESSDGFFKFYATAQQDDWSSLAEETVRLSNNYLTKIAFYLNSKHHDRVINDLCQYGKDSGRLDDVIRQLKDEHSFNLNCTSTSNGDVPQD